MIPILGTVLTPLLYLLLSSPRDPASIISPKDSNTMSNEKVQPFPSVGPAFEVRSCWSKAGIGTCFVLEQKMPEHSIKMSKKVRSGMKIVFDLGCTPIIHETFVSNAVILSHAHMDHFGGIFGHARAHAMTCGGSTPTYYVPSELVAKLEKARECFSDIDATCTQSTQDDDMPNVNRRDKSLLNMKIVPVRAGEEIEIKQNKVRNGVRFYLRPFDVCHGGHPALGYSVVSKTTKKCLKEEYRGIDRSNFSKVVKEGAVLYDTEVVERVEVCYTGDTNVDGLLGKGISKNEQSQLYLKEAFTAPLIISELTYLEKKDQELGKSRGHLNVFDIQPIFESHGWGLAKNNESGESFGANGGAFNKDRKIVFYHLSGRHGTAERIIHGIEKALPRDLLKVTEVALSSFIPDPEATTIPIAKNGCVSMKDYLDETGIRIEHKKTEL